ncbi:MAG: M48 family metalloprotease [Candidatus Eisenbacteria bacterium]|nr:M48 family metalloprotease [Candidatus Eisenbacteria bacterium]
MVKGREDVRTVGLRSGPILLGLLLVLAAGCATVPVTGRQQLALVPDRELVMMGADNYAQLMERSEIVTSGPEVDSVVRVGRRIAESTERFLVENGLENEVRAYDWQFNLIEDDAVNAFCMPGGRIGVYTGILDVTRDDEGLAVVMAHEVAHAVAGHSNERMSQMLIAELGGTALSRALDEEPERTRQLAMAAYGLGAQVGVLLPYSRRHESEADRIGLILMARAGYDPRAAVPFWRRMAREGGQTPPEFLSTHPHPDTRIEDIETHLPEAIEIYERERS